MATTAVATQDERREVTVRDLPAVIRTSKSARAQLQAFLPEGVSLERVAASVDLALRKARQDHKGDGVPALELCEPATVLLAVAKIQQWGLEVGETAHLVPFGKTCTPVADYKGLEELMIASGVARMVQSRCVYASEPFRMSIGTTTVIEHQPIAAGGARGAMIGAYAIVHVRGGLQLVEYMTVEEIDIIRKTHSKQWKGGVLTEWYARKTVIRRVAKHVPKNPRLAKLLAEIDREEVVEVPEALARAMVAPVGEEEAPQVHRLSAPRPLAQAGDGAYGLTPVAPCSVNDHSEADRGPVHSDEDFIDDRDLVDGELPLGAERTAPTPRRRDAIREG